MVFELMAGGNLERLCRKRKEPFSEGHLRSVIFQILAGICHMHSLHFLHRDLKPENILLSTRVVKDMPVVKLADLGLAKYIGSPREENRRPHTAYVATRWYRSPEILLRMKEYGTPSDLWAVGTIIAEILSLGCPLFPGEDEKDQLARVVALRGHPSVVDWADGVAAMTRRRIRLPRTTPSSMQTAVPHASLPVLQLLTDLLEMDPARRPTAAEALQYPLFIIDPAVGTGDKQLLESHGWKDSHRQPGTQRWTTGQTADCPSSRLSLGGVEDAGEGSERRIAIDMLPHSQHFGTGAIQLAGAHRKPVVRLMKNGTPQYAQHQHQLCSSAEIPHDHANAQVPQRHSITQYEVKRSTPIRPNLQKSNKHFQKVSSLFAIPFVKNSDSSQIGNKFGDDTHGQVPPRSPAGHFNLRFNMS